MSLSHAVRKPSPPVPADVVPQPDAAVDHMRSYLGGMRPMSVAEQLRLLRTAFPDAPLADRVSACAPRT